uniref:Uncharacterized protein n=1 Tax=Helicotheca tamesis TaxID=374047 RepID=A0A7S2DZV5_9STRA|mmetsp:Transcript_11131/g.15426  ORF Transcript_11131/g.15426 Transcript_11131/m.15426 type:complete len:134 (+) Transcript_11131:115-516(+)
MTKTTIIISLTMVTLASSVASAFVQNVAIDSRCVTRTRPFYGTEWCTLQLHPDEAPELEEKAEIFMKALADARREESTDDLHMKLKRTSSANVAAAATAEGRGKAMQAPGGKRMPGSLFSRFFSRPSRPNNHN